MASEFTITGVCENNHSQTIIYSGPFCSREWAELQAALVDGSSALYTYPPIGTDSTIGKCGICRAQIHCTVAEVEKAVN